MKHYVLGKRFALLPMLLLASMQPVFAGPGDWSGQGPFGGNVETLHTDPLVPTRLYAATANGFFRSDDAGASWTSAEDGLLSPHPLNGIFSVSGAVSGGLALFDDAGRLNVSSDGGNTWLPTGYVAPASLSTTTNALALGSAGTIWFAADSGGLLVSADNGVTFAPAGGSGFPSGSTAFPIVVTNPADPQQVIAGSASGCDVVTGNCPIYVSADGGATWSMASISGGTTTASGTQRPTAIAFGPGTTVYALYGELYTSGELLSSSDGGLHWTAHAHSGLTLAAAPNDANTLWVNDSKSIDGGVTFTPLATAGRTTNGVFVPDTSAIAVSPNYATTPRLWIGTYSAGVYLSNDGGATWTASNDGMAATMIRTVVVHPVDNSRIFAGFGDSIYEPSPAFYRSTTLGAWTASNAGLNAYQLRTILIDPTTAGTIGSTVIYAVGSGFDGSGAVASQRNSGIYKSSDGGLTWTTKSGGIPAYAGTGLWAGNLRTIIADPRSCDSRGSTAPVCTSGPLLTLYVTGGGRPNGAGPHPYRVMKSTDGGENWTDSSTGLPDDIVGMDGSYDEIAGVTPIVMDPSDSNVLYIGTFAAAYDAMNNPLVPQVLNGVYKSTNAGASWTFMSTGLPTYTGSSAVLDTLSLAIDAGNPQTLWVSTIDYDFNPGAPGQIYKTTDGGMNWNLSNAGVSGPDVRALLADPANPGTIYAASGGLGPANPGGVYKSTDGGANWMSISVGLPAFSATALTLDPVDPTVLYAGTSGGVYAIVQLPDADADGVPDLVENAGPNGGDANHDNSPDAEQSYVGTTAPGLFGGYGWQAGIDGASQTARNAQLRQMLRTAASGIQGGYFTVQVNGGCTQAVDVAPVNPGPLGADREPHHGTYTYPRGLLRFELPQCAAATVDIMFNAATFGPGWSWRYYGPSTPGDNSTMGWHDATSLVTAQSGNDWQIDLAKGSFGSYRPAVTDSILFEGGPAYNDTVFNDGFD